MSLEKRRIALVEDDPIMGESLVQRLELEGARVHWWQSIGEAADGLGQVEADAVICDIRLPDGTGEDLYRLLARTHRLPPFLFITGYGDVGQAVRLVREGAHDYITKPFAMDDFLERLGLALGPSELDEPEPVLGVSPASRSLEAFLQKAVHAQAPLLLTGETGVGKEVAARLLHTLRSEPRGPFVAVNCAALPAELIESELFGHEKGAFTGAHTRHLGYAERASGGILFLDEIGELAPRLQAKLLRLIEQRQFSRVGGEHLVAFSARLICATNVDLQACVRQGTFREDLFYRINVLSADIAPLRMRREDISWLMDRVLIHLQARLGTNIRGFTPSAYIEAEAHDWPGNVRELGNRIERGLTMATGPWLLPSDLFPERGLKQGASELPRLSSALDEAERRHIERALKANDGAMIATARMLGISRTTLWEKMRRHDLAR